MYSTKTALCITLFLALLEVVSCLQCYHCNSRDDLKCTENFSSNVKPLDCSSKDSTQYKDQHLYPVLPSEVFQGIIGAPKYCHTMVLETGTIYRACLESDASNKEKSCKAMVEESKSEVSNKKVVSCKVCDKDNCNGASSLSLSLPLSALTLAISYLIYKQ